MSANLEMTRYSRLALVEPSDLDVEVELVDDVARRWAEPGDVGPQVAGDLARVVEETAEVERARCCRTARPATACKHRLDVLDLALQRSWPVQHRGLGWLQDAVEAADDGERQDDLAVLGLLVVAPEEVGH